MLSTKEQRRAKQKIVYLSNKADKRGKIIKPACCQGCGITTEKLERHHNDYNKIYEVEWLCTKCHGKRHRRTSPDYVSPVLPEAIPPKREKVTGKKRSYRIPEKLKLMMKRDGLSFYRWCINNGFKHSTVNHLFSGETVGLWGQAKEAKGLLDRDYAGWNEYIDKPETVQLMCRKCGHIWKPLISDPEFCPKCKNAKWWTEKRIHNKKARHRTGQ